MRKFSAIYSLIIFISINAAAQDNIEFKLCNQDFRELSLRENLPVNAVYTNKNASADARERMLEPGEFIIEAGSSSQDIKQKISVFY